MKLKEATASKKDGFNIFRVFSPISTAYEYMIGVVFRVMNII
jgi:hypothetical protein